MNLWKLLNNAQKSLTSAADILYVFLQKLLWLQWIFNNLLKFAIIQLMFIINNNNNNSLNDFPKFDWNIWFHVCFSLAMNLMTEWAHLCTSLQNQILLLFVIQFAQFVEFTYIVDFVLFIFNISIRTCSVKL